MSTDSWVENVASTQLWKMFSPPIFKRLCERKARHPRLFLGGLLEQGNSKRNPRVSEMYAAAFRHLSLNQPTEYLYKNALLQWQILSGQGSKRSRVIFEFRSGQSKLDALVVGDVAHAFEIKTERDQLKRLHSQIADYRRRFAFVTVLASEKHVAQIERQLPLSVGVAYLTRRRVFQHARTASYDDGALQPELMLECLRRSEYLAVLESFGFNFEGIPNTLIFYEGMKYAKNLDPNKLVSAVSELLRNREGTLSASELRRLPIAVRAAAVASKCSNECLEYLIKNLRTRARSSR